MINHSLYLCNGLSTVLIGKEYVQPGKDDFPATSYKNADIEVVLENTTDYVRDIIGGVKLLNTHRHVLVDVKVHDLGISDIPALPNIHMDFCRNPIERRPDEIHNLFVSGSAALTEFLTNDIWVFCPETGNVNWNKILANTHFSPIKSCVIHTYGEHVHKAVPAKFPEKRLLVRVTETSRVEPSNKPFKVTYK